MIRAAIILAIAAALFSAGFGLGWIASAHKHDAADLAATSGQLTATQHAFDQSQRDWRDALAQFRRDTAALHGIAEDYAHDQDTRTRYFGTLNNRLAWAIAARPAVAACDIGPDGLQVWNDANRGAPAASGDAAAAADDRRGAAATMPVGLAAGAERQAARPAGQSSAGHAAVPRLRKPPQPNHSRGGKTRSHRSGARGVSGSAVAASRLALIEDTGDTQ